MKKKKNRSATFVCSLCFNLSEKKKFFVVTGKLNGKIAFEMKGKNGFGYDPIFIPSGHKVTFGEMKKSKKIKIDHRFIAYKKLIKKVKIL